MSREFWKQYSIQQPVKQESESARVVRYARNRAHGARVAPIAQAKSDESPGLRYRREQVPRLENELALTGDASKLPAVQYARSGLARQEEHAARKRVSKLKVGE